MPFRLRATLILTCLQACIFPAAAQTKFSPVAWIGQSVPGTDSAGVFQNFYAQTISPSGVVAFQAQVGGGDSFGPYGIWAGTSSGSLSLVARQSTPAPGTNGVTYNSFTDPVIGVQNKITFSAVLNNSNDGIWFGNASAPALSALDGSAAPGTSSGVVFDHFDAPLVTSTSNTFVGYLRGTGIPIGTIDAGVWSGQPGALTLLARKGATAPGAGSGVKYSTFNFLQGNTTGALAFEGALSTFNHAIFAGASGAISAVAVQGNSAPGLTGLKYYDFTEPALARNSNRIAFSSRLTGSNVTASNDSAIWSGSFGAVSLVARAGSQAPGLDAGVRFGSFFTNTISSAPLVADGGQVAFQVLLTGTGVTSANDTSIWSGLPGSLRLVAREGTHAPGTPDGVNFDALDALDGLDKPYINSLGEVAFVSQLVGLNVDSSNNVGLWATDLSGNLLLVARSGDSIDIGGGAMRTLAGVYIIRSVNDGTQTVFNEAGQIVFGAGFTDGTGGIIVATVPEPRSIFYITSGLLTFLLLRSRKVHRFRF